MISLRNYIEDFRGDVNKRFEHVDDEFRDVRGAISELSAQVRDYHTD